MKTMHFVRKFAVLAASAAVLAGCAATTFVKPDGTTDEPVWPQWNKVTFDNGRGTFPNPESLRQVKAGMTKDQLYYLLGRPHYGEAWRPVEWNYLFYFHTPGQGTDNVTTCQYKVLFDKDMIARNFYWNPIDPQGTACPIEGKAAAGDQRYTLGADALFAFNRSGTNDLQAQGRRELDDLAAKLKTFERLDSITVTGHTDYLGSDAYNQNLSQQRAQTVRQYLIGQGLPAAKIRAVGAGERQPVKQCADNGSRADLSACLQPNRRVEIQVEGYGRH